MRAGDIYTMNDPHDGGTHLPDLIIAAPAVVDGRVVAFSVCLAHQEDFGGKVPGSMPTELNRDLPGRSDRPAAQALRRRAAGRDIVQDDRAQRASAAPGAGRYRRAGLRGDGRLRAHRRSVPLGRHREGAGLHGPPARLCRAAHARAHCRNPGRGLLASPITWTTMASISTAACRSPSPLLFAAATPSSTMPARAHRFGGRSTRRFRARTPRSISPFAASRIPRSRTTTAAIGRSGSSCRRDVFSIRHLGRPLPSARTR